VVDHIHSLPDLRQPVQRGWQQCQPYVSQERPDSHELMGGWPWSFGHAVAGGGESLHAGGLLVETLFTLYLSIICNACAFFESGVLQLLHALRIAETRPCRLFPNEAFLDEQRENYLYFGNERLSAGRSEERAARRGVVLRVMYKIELQRGRFGIRYEQRSQVPHRPALPSCYVTVEQDHVTLAPYYPY
jgi:hypothetical protein